MSGYRRPQDLAGSEAPLPLTHLRRLPAPLPDHAESLVRALLAVRPEQRLTAAEASSHDFFKCCRPPAMRLNVKQKPTSTPRLRARPFEVRRPADPPRPLSGTAAAQSLATSQAMRPPPAPSTKKIKKAADPDANEDSATPDADAGIASASPGLCQCNYNCRNTGGTHLRAADNSRPCRLEPLPGLTFCKSCKCQKTQCPFSKHRSAFCRRHRVCEFEDRNLYVMSQLSATLSLLTPMDLVAFRDLPPTASFPLLVVLAQLWEPEAVHHVLRRLRGHHQPTASAIKGALTDALQHLSSQISNDTELGQLICERHEVLKENGACRLLGPASLCQRLRLIQKTQGGPLLLGIGGEHYNWMDDRVNVAPPPPQTLKSQESARSRGARATATPDALSPLQRLVKAISTPQFSSTELQNSDVLKILRDLDGSLQALPGWACMGTDSAYIRPHVLRKVRLWILHNHGPATNELLTLTRAQWASLSPDEGGHLTRIPAELTLDSVQSYVPKVDVMLWSMWCCLLGPCFRLPGAAEWFARDEQLLAREWDAAARFLILQTPGCTPSPRQVTQHAMTATGMLRPELSRTQTSQK